MKGVFARWKRRGGEKLPKRGHAYLEGRYSFERLFGDLAQSRRLWQAVALTALIANGALTAGFIVLARTHKVVPYIVEVDALGEVRAASELGVADPPEHAMQVALRRFIHNMRTVPSDLRLLNVQLKRAQAFVAGHALTTFMREVRGKTETLVEMLRRKETRYVEEISSVLKVPGESGVYRIAWRESGDLAPGSVAQTFEGHFKVRVIAPDDAEILLDNPLGIFVTDYTWAATGQHP